MMYDKGIYQVEILGQGFDKALTGTDEFFVRIRPLKRYDDQGNLQECPQNERRYRQNLSTEIGVRILLNDLRSLGVSITGLEQLHPGNPEFVNLAGRVIDLECSRSLSDRIEREQWTVARKPVTVDAVRELQAKYGHLLRNGHDQTAAPTA